MTPQELQAAARAKLATSEQVFIDPTAQVAMPIIVQQVIPKLDRPTQSKHVLEAHLASFTVLVKGRRIMFNNYRYETDDSTMADILISEYSPRIWRAEYGNLSTAS